MSPSHLLYDIFGRKDFSLSNRLIQCHLALYKIRVPRSGDLPPTAFTIRDSHPIDYTHAGRTKKAIEGLPPFMAFWYFTVLITRSYCMLANLLR